MNLLQKVTFRIVRRFNATVFSLLDPGKKATLCDLQQVDCIDCERCNIPTFFNRNAPNAGKPGYTPRSICNLCLEKYATLRCRVCDNSFVVDITLDQKEYILTWCDRCIEQVPEEELKKLDFYLPRAVIDNPNLREMVEHVLTASDAELVKLYNKFCIRQFRINRVIRFWQLKNKISQRKVMSFFLKHRTLIQPNVFVARVFPLLSERQARSLPQYKGNLTEIGGYGSEITEKDMQDIGKDIQAFSDRNDEIILRKNGTLNYIYDLDVNGMPIYTDNLEEAFITTPIAGRTIVGLINGNVHIEEVGEAHEWQYFDFVPVCFVLRIVQQEGLKTYLKSYVGVHNEAPKTTTNIDEALRHTSPHAQLLIKDYAHEYEWNIERVMIERKHEKGADDQS